MRIAIDPGVGGGIAYEDTDGSVHALPMPATLGDMRAQLEIIADHGTVCYIEELPRWAGKMSGSSMATMFQNYGRLEGLLTSRNTKIVYLKPQAWQKVMALGEKKTYGSRWKAHLKERAQALFPQLTITLKTADALLIMEASRRIHPQN